VVNKLTGAGMPEEDAETIAEILVFADLRGVHSHGVLRVEHYEKRIRAGGMNLNAKLKVRMLKPTIGLLDARGSAGHIAAKFAAEAAIAAARKEGMAVVGIKNSSHCGALAYYVQMGVDAKMAAMMCVNTDTCKVPYGGRDAYFGTNPFAFGFPGEKESILLDMATSEVAWGKVLHAREKNLTIPESWAVDKEGRACSDPHKAAALPPFGGAKGYGITIMVEALTGLMIGGVFGPHLKKMYGDYDVYRDLSNFIMMIDPSVFGGGDEFLARTQRMIDELHRQVPAPGFERVMIPGEIERNHMARYGREGIPVPRSIHAYLAG
jgi:ureidoglycolate dehydrogenase (NAD+)